MFRIYGENNKLEIVFNDPFNAFKNALKEFTRSIRYKKKFINTKNIIEIVSFIELGR